MIGTQTYSASYYNPVSSRMAGQVPVLKWKNVSAVSPSVNQPVQTANTAPAKAAASSDGSGNTLSFFGFMKGIFDIINPLQHIPVIGAIYRHLTGDEISPMARIAGDSLYGGPIGGAFAMADIAVQKSTGKDIGETVIAKLTGHGSPAPADSTMIAQNFDKNISPAAGGSAPRNIIWNTPANKISTHSLLSRATTPTQPNRAGIIWNKPVVSSTPTPATPSVFAPKDATRSAAAQLTASDADSTTVLRTQGAPAPLGPTPVAPELIPGKMMEGLDKYQAMMRAADAATPQYLGTY